MRVIVGVLSLLVVACGARDVIPSGGTHPANPDAPVGTAPPDPAPPPPAAAPDAAPARDDRAAIAEAERAAYEAARPVFEKHCARCHSPAGAKQSKKKLEHFDLGRYPFGGHHANEIGALVREVLGAGGEKPTMPMDDPGAVKGAELEAIVAWSKAFDAAHAAGLHEGHDQGDPHGGHGGH